MPADAMTPEERFDFLGRRLFAADPVKLKERLAAEEAMPKKRGRPRKDPEPTP